MENLFSIAQQMANDIPDDEKEKIQQMDMNSMIQHVTKNVMNMMNDPDALKTNPLLAMASQEMGNENITETFKDQKKRSKKSKRIEDVEDGDNDEEAIMPKTKDLHFSINVNLEDLYKGKNKKIAVKRKRIKSTKDKNGKPKKEIVTEKKTISIPILPGTVDGQTITFQGYADEKPGYIPGDVIVTINENEHDVFERDGDNLLLVKNISLSETFGFNYKIKHLDGHILEIKSSPDDILHLNDGVRKIEGEGMPILEQDFDRENEDEEETSEQKFGDLFMRFNLVLPEKIDKEHIKTIKKIFPPLEEDNLEITEETPVISKKLEQVTEEDIEKLGAEYDSDDFDSDEEDDSDFDSDDEISSSDEEEDLSEEEEEEDSFSDESE